MSIEKSLVCAFKIQKNGQSQELTTEDVIKITSRPKDDNWYWIHWDFDEGGFPEWLENYQDMQHSIADALMSAKCRPRFVQLDEAALLILRGVNLNPGQDMEDMISVRLWMDQNIIITSRRVKMMAVDAIRTDIENGTGPKSPAALVLKLAEGLTVRINDKVEALDERLEKLEDDADEISIDKARHSLRDIRSKAITLTRYLKPQKPALDELMLVADDYFDKEQKGTLRMISSRLANATDELVAVSERATAHNDELMTEQTERMNKAMYVLAIVTAIFLPLSLFTGLLGINVGGMPGEGWWPAFWIVLAIMGGMGFATYRILKDQDFI